MWRLLSHKLVGCKKLAGRTEVFTKTIGSQTLHVPAQTGYLLGRNPKEFAKSVPRCPDLGVKAP